MIFVRITLIVYWLFLTTLLLVPNPAALFGRLPGPMTPSVGVHLTFFALLGLLCGLSRIRASFWSLILTLAVYAVAIESLQTLFPPRTVELRDYAENLVGIGLGMALAAAILAWRGRKPADRRVCD